MPKADSAPAFRIEEQPLAFEFTLEDYMILSRSKRVEHDTGDIIEKVLPTWGPHLHARKLTTMEPAGEQGYMLVWLDEGVENEVNQAWEGSPSRAFVLNTLAQTLLTAALRNAVPEISMQGATVCAPVPTPNKPLREALKAAGVPWEEGAMLSRQYAMLTYAPFKGSCDICFVKAECPKLAFEQDRP